MEIEDSDQPSGPQGSQPSGGSSGDNRPRSRRPRNEGPGGERRGDSRERSSSGGDRYGGGEQRPRRERAGRSDDRLAGRRSGGSRDRDAKKTEAAPVSQAPVATAKPLEELGGDFLASVSRSFSLTIRLLPDPLREPITLGYLLARALDTVADTPAVLPGSRLEHLRALSDMIKYGADPEVLRPLQRDLVGKQAHAGERELLKGLDRTLDWLENQPVDDRWDLRRTLARIGRGQELDLLRFGEGTATSPKPLATAAELDEYTYFVAGCVGELWTRLCQRHLFAGWSKLGESKMLALGKRFGQGLQMVNILRDLPEDLANGRCYLPEELLAQHGLSVPDLLDSPRKASPLLDQLRQATLEHLDAGWQYVQALTSRKLRYACALPILLGLETLGLLAQTSPLETSEQLKISRGSVKKLMASATVGTFVAPWLNHLYRRARTRAAAK